MKQGPSFRLSGLVGKQFVDTQTKYPRLYCHAALRHLLAWYLVQSEDISKVHWAQYHTWCRCTVVFTAGMGPSGSSVGNHEGRCACGGRGKLCEQQHRRYFSNPWLILSLNSGLGMVDECQADWEPQLFPEMTAETGYKVWGPRSDKMSIGGLWCWTTSRSTTSAVWERWGVRVAEQIRLSI